MAAAHRSLELLPTAALLPFPVIVSYIRCRAKSRFPPCAFAAPPSPAPSCRLLPCHPVTASPCRTPPATPASAARGGRRIQRAPARPSHVDRVPRKLAAVATALPRPLLRSDPGLRRPCHHHCLGARPFPKSSTNRALRRDPCCPARPASCRPPHRLPEPQRRRVSLAPCLLPRPCSSRERSHARAVR